jgi:hypothetical protein
MDLYQVTRSISLIALATLIGTCIIADIQAGEKIEDRVILALISALITVYTFVS